MGRSAGRRRTPPSRVDEPAFAMFIDEVERFLAE